jgi:hypothetical protein
VQSPEALAHKLRCDNQYLVMQKKGWSLRPPLFSV